MNMARLIGSALLVTISLALLIWLLVSARQPSSPATPPADLPASGSSDIAVPGTAVAAGSPGDQATAGGTQSKVPGFAVDLPDLRQLRPGDPFSLVIPQEQVEYYGSVESVDLTEAGSTRIIGLFSVEGNPYRFVFTIGRTYTFGTLHTPAGRYQLQSKDGLGFIVATTVINKSRDFSKPDYVIPQQTPHRGNGS